MTIRLIIARHGNTFENGQTPTRVGGRTDLPLVESGVGQANKLGAALRDAGLIPSHVFTSNLGRTINTARIACDAMGCECVHEPAAFLNEIDYGVDENKPEPDLIARIGIDAIHNWDKNGIMPDAWSPRPEQIIKNWQDFLQNLTQQFNNQTVMAVTSNGIARFALNCTVNGVEFPLKLATGAYGVLTTNQSGDWFVDCWNIRP